MESGWGIASCRRGQEFIHLFRKPRFQTCRLSLVDNPSLGCFVYHTNGGFKTGLDLINIFSFQRSSNLFNLASKGGFGGSVFQIPFLVLPHAFCLCSFIRHVLKPPSLKILSRPCIISGKQNAKEVIFCLFLRQVLNFWFNAVSYFLSLIFKTQTVNNTHYQLTNRGVRNIKHS